MDAFSYLLQEKPLVTEDAKKISRVTVIGRKNIKNKVTAGRKSMPDLYINPKTLAALEEWKED